MEGRGDVGQQAEDEKRVVMIIKLDSDSQFQKGCF